MSKSIAVHFCFCLQRYYFLPAYASLVRILYIFCTVSFVLWLKIVYDLQPGCTKFAVPLHSKMKTAKTKTADQLCISMVNC